MTVVSWGCGARRRRSGPNIGTKRGHRKGKRRPAAHEKGRPGGRPSIPVVAGWTLKAARWRRAGQASLDLGFLELDMLARTRVVRSEEHTSELQSLMRISYAVFCLKKKKNI